MSKIPDSLQRLFETSLEDDGDRYVVPIPKELVENGSVSTNDVPYRADDGHEYAHTRD